MPKFIVSPEGEAWALLSRELDRMRALLVAPEVNMNDLGRSLASVVVSARAVFVFAGMASVRMDAAAKALDLRTQKSELEQFVQPESQRR